MKFIFLASFTIIFLGCSSASLTSTWNRTKQASYNAATDYVSWAPLLGATALYSTDYDTQLTNYIIDKQFLNNDIDDTFRSLNSYETYLSGLFIHESSYTTKGKRILSEVFAFQTSVIASDALNHIDKRSPDNIHYYAIDSQHALGPFAGSAMTRRNVTQLSIPQWSKYTLNTFSYATATASALTRVQDKGHSFADQLIGASVGNFIGIFMHDIFMLDEHATLYASVYNNTHYLQFNYRF